MSASQLYAFLVVTHFSSPMEEEGQTETDALLELAFLSTKVYSTILSTKVLYIYIYIYMYLLFKIFSLKDVIFQKNASATSPLPIDAPVESSLSP